MKEEKTQGSFVREKKISCFLAEPEARKKVDSKEKSIFTKSKFVMFERKTNNKIDDVKRWRKKERKNENVLFGIFFA